MTLNRDSLDEQDFINYCSIPSLESIAIVNFAAGLCMQPDLRDAIRQHSLEYDSVAPSMSDFRSTLENKSLNTLESIFISKLSFVQLPNLLKLKVANIYQPVVLQLLQWIRHGYKDVKYISAVCWTVQGTIDKVKTFEKLINNSSVKFHINSFFELACRCCLEDSIFNIWNKIPKTLQNDYCKKVYRTYDNHLIAYWISNVKNELSGFLGRIKHYDHNDIYSCNSTICKNMFTLAVLNGNILAAKYFWNKLTNEEISSNLSQWIKYSLHNRLRIDDIHQNIYDNSEVQFFLLSQMHDSSQQIEIFQEHSKVILLSLFSDWPWQRFLLPTIEKIWFSLDQNVYLELLENIVNKIKENKTTHELLKKLWQNSPINFKKCFIQYIMRFKTDVLCNLLNVGDIETIKFILYYANVEEKKHITFSIVENYKLYEVIYAEKLSLFDMILSNTLSSDSDIQNLKEKITLRYGNRLCCDWICDDNFQMVEKFFKWVFTSQDQIDYFKNDVLDKNNVTYRILKDLRNYELVDKFMNWCFRTELEVNKFKKNFAKSVCEIVMVGENDWGAFAKFIDWCFISDHDIQDFKRSMLQSGQIDKIIFFQIAYECNFEFIDRLISWCCISNEQIKQFKEGFVLSSTWLDIFQIFVRDNQVNDKEYNNWELIRKLLKVFFPLEQNVTNELKKIISKEVDFNDFYWGEKKHSYKINKKDLFCLIDNNDYNKDDNNCSSEN